MNKIQIKLFFGCLFAVFIVILSLLSNPLFSFFQFSKPTLFFISRIAIWIALLLVFIYAKYVEKENFMLWKETNFSLFEYISSFFKIYGLLFLLLMIFGIVIKFIGIKPNYNNVEKLMFVFKNNILLAIFFCFTAGVTEELIFRAYLIPRLQIIFKSAFLSIIVSSMLFGLLHFGFGNWIQIIGPMIIGIVFAVHYNQHKNIKILMVCHFLWDFMIVFANVFLNVKQ